MQETSAQDKRCVEFFVDGKHVENLVVEMNTELIIDQITKYAMENNALPVFAVGIGKDGVHMFVGSREDFNASTSQRVPMTMGGVDYDKEKNVFSRR